MRGRGAGGQGVARRGQRGRRGRGDKPGAFGVKMVGALVAWAFEPEEEIGAQKGAATQQNQAQGQGGSFGHAGLYHGFSRRMAKGGFPRKAAQNPGFSGMP